MKTLVLLADDNVSRSADRRQHLVTAEVEVIIAGDECQAEEALNSCRVDVVCIDMQFVVNRGDEVGAFIKSLKPFVPVVLIADGDRVPGHFEEHVDIVLIARISMSQGDG
jgi:DNA-binding NtrC family response regulator